MTSLGFTIFAIAPGLLGLLLLWLRPRLFAMALSRRGAISTLFYLAFLSAVVSGALGLVAWIASARLPPAEIVLVVWFTIILRLVWEVWSIFVGRRCENWRRWARRRRSRGTGDAAAALGLVIAPARLLLTLTAFIPAALAFVLTHRFKLTDGLNPRDTLGMNYEEVNVSLGANESLACWFIPSPEADQTILICHGAGANKGNFIWFVPPLAHRGYNLVLFDFRAHGGSTGRTCSYGLDEMHDVLAITAWLKTARPDKSRRIVGLGSSLGSMALLRAAAATPAIDALILDSPFVSPRSLAQHHLGKIPLLGPAFGDLVLWWMGIWTQADFLHDGAGFAIRRISPRPLMIIHGDRDVIMPASHSRELFELAAEPRSIWMGPGPHSNIITTEPEEYADRVMRFLSEHLPAH